MPAWQSETPGMSLPRVLKPKDGFADERCKQVPHNAEQGRDGVGCIPIQNQSGSGEKYRAMPEWLLNPVTRSSTLPPSRSAR